MTECWSHEPQVRLPVLRIKKTLAKALEKHKEIYGPKVNAPVAEFKKQDDYPVLTN